MRQQLLLVVGVAGSLVVNPLAVAHQLSGDTSTFTSQVAATCSFDGLADSYAMTYYGNGNYLRGTASFDVMTNVAELRFGVSTVATNSEPAASNGRNVYVTADFFRVQGNVWSLLARGNKSSSGTTQSVDVSQGNAFILTSFVNTNDPVSSRYFLSPGQYSYTVTLSCLL